MIDRGGGAKRKTPMPKSKTETIPYRRTAPPPLCARRGDLNSRRLCITQAGVYHTALVCRSFPAVKSWRDSTTLWQLNEGFMLERRRGFEPRSHKMGHLCAFTICYAAGVYE